MAKARRVPRSKCYQPNTDDTAGSRPSSCFAKTWCYHLLSPRLPRTPKSRLANARSHPPARIFCFSVTFSKSGTQKITGYQPWQIMSFATDHNTHRLIGYERFPLWPQKLCTVKPCPTSRYLVACWEAPTQPYGSSLFSTSGLDNAGV